MTAELLREAAAKMRERAKAATPGPWNAWVNQAGVPNLVKMRQKPATFAVVHTDQKDVRGVLGGTTEHIASWHPAVALAVADWLDAEARLSEASSWYPDAGESLAVARAYLGRES